MPVGTATDLLERGVDVCERNGYRVTRPESGREPDALAEPGPEATALVPAGVAAVAVEPLRAGEATPTTLVSRLWDAVDRGRGVLFVVPDAAVGTALDVLRDPPFVAAADGDGRRFYNGPDRVALAGGGYALARPAAEYRWREARAEEARPGRDVEGSRLVLRAENGPIATLDGVAALDSPPADVFPFSYRRGPEKRTRVRGSDGREVGAFAGVRALRDAGFEPVPMPLVPEHVFGDAEPATAWTVLDGDGELRTVRG
ncbi:MAG: hypothetical protein ABEH47_09245 [Haloferacaceae archaeon]